MHTETPKKSLWVLTPLFGSLLYGSLYVIATLFYPGGSQFNKEAKGFSWVHNYWCNLLNEHAINGQPNPARPIALTALVLLCTTLALFWYILPLYVPLQKSARLLMQFSGMASMATGLFLFTAWHDMVINVASLLGLIAFAITMSGLKRLGWIKLFRMGFFIILLIAANNVLYYGNGLIYYLPVVQKITFFYFLFWVSLISLCLYN